MIKMVTAYTREADDAQKAVCEILGQLNLELNLRRNSVGIMMYYPDFCDTGVAKAICAALPFDVIGGSTSDASVPGAMDDIILTLAVLTSDDANFAAGAARVCGGATRDALGALCHNLRSRLPEPPVLFYTLFPILDDVPTDEYIDAIDEFSGGVPLFGSIAFTPNVDFSDVRTFCNGEEYRDVVALVAISGACSPKFYTTTMSEATILHQAAIITDSERNCMRGINEMPALEFFESIGLAENGRVAGISSMPLILTLPDGSQIIRVPYKVTDEGYILAHGSTPSGSTIRFGRGDSNYVVTSAEELLSIISGHDGDAVFIYSCVARKWAMGARSEEEMRKVAEYLDGKFQYSYACSGGEICPVPRDDGTLVNRLHHFTLIACSL
ncbi:MAG: FIST C-terminal domain-containing protein [Synergistaceae bacterium]|jgi:hypothetical protein|nr:FIST C-terminal domain-containing protein [Synergistaceae bacterium]